MIEIVGGLMFLLFIMWLGTRIYRHGTVYEQTKRLKQVAAPRDDDLSWSLKHTSAGYAAQNQVTVVRRPPA